METNKFTKAEVMWAINNTKSYIGAAEKLGIIPIVKGYRDTVSGMKNIFSLMEKYGLLPEERGSHDWWK